MWGKLILTNTLFVKIIRPLWLAEMCKMGKVVAMYHLLDLVTALHVNIHVLFSKCSLKYHFIFLVKLLAKY